jgi:large subunit ribosomal protein L1
MSNRSKLYRSQNAGLDKSEALSLKDAVEKLKAMPQPKFDQTVEVVFNLGVDPRQSDQNVRGATALPHGTGRTVRVVVIASDEAAEAAREAGADHVGFEELLEKIQGGWLDFDAMIATPAAMQKVRPLGRVLGPRGLMPNPKTGTVTDDPASAVKAAKAGRVEYRSDRGGVVAAPVGKLSFNVDALVDNANAVVQAILRARPASAKGTYLQSCTLSATMSPGIKIDTRQFVRS